MLQICATLLVGLVGGYAALHCGLPLPWLIGSIGSVAVYQLATGAARSPRWLRHLGQLLLGSAIGLYFSPAAASEISTFAVLIVALAIFSIASAYFMSIALQRLTNLDSATSYFASMPGGVSEMVILAEKFGGDPVLVTMFQSIRLIVVVFSIPTIIFVGFDTLPVDLDLQHQSFDALGIMSLFSCAAIVSIAFHKVGVPNSWFIGPLLVGTAASLYDHGAIYIPGPLVEAGQVLIGCALGSRFQKGALTQMGRLLPVSIGLTLGLILLNIAISAISAMLFSMPLSSIILGTAPGGIAEMGITAKAAGVDVAVVTAFHLVRILFILILSAPLYVFTRRVFQV